MTRAGLQTLVRNLPPQSADAAIAAALLAASATFYASLAGVIAGGPLLGEDNLVFDFDPSRYIRMWCESPFPSDEVDPQYLVRHPLILAVRPVCVALVALGIPQNAAALAIEILSVAASVALVFICGRVLGASRLFSAATALLFACSAVTLFLAVIPEAYGPGATALLLQFLIAAYWCRVGPPRLAYRLAAGIANFGITITNFALSVMCETVNRFRALPLVRLARDLAFYIGAVVVAGTVVGAALTYVYVGGTLSGAETAKRVWWVVNMDTQYRQPPQAVLATFTVSAVVAPTFSEVMIGPDEKLDRMLDFRRLNFGTAGIVAIVPWLLLIGASSFAAARDKALRPFWLLVGGWFVFNVVLHAFWHLRGSVFLYAAHPHVALILLPFALERLVAAHRWRSLGAAGLVLAAALTAAWNNLERFHEMASILSSWR